MDPSCPTGKVRCEAWGQGLVDEGRGVVVQVWQGNSVVSAVTVYPSGPERDGARPAVLVLPGGGYREHSGNAGEAVARWLADIGFHAFTLRYRLKPQLFPTALADARAGLDYIRSEAHGLAVDPHRVGVIGFSAGGHLAGMLTAGTILAGESYEGVAPVPPSPSWLTRSQTLTSWTSPRLIDWWGTLRRCMTNCLRLAISTTSPAPRLSGRPAKTSQG